MVIAPHKALHLYALACAICAQAPRYVQGIHAHVDAELFASKIDDFSCLKRASCEGTFQYVPPANTSTTVHTESEKLQSLIPRTADLASVASIEQCFSQWKDFNLESGNHQKTKSTNREDEIIFEKFFKKAGVPRTDGFFLEMGAFNGLTESNSLFFERCLGWKGLLVEANPVTYEVMVKNNTRPTAHKLNMAPSCSSDDGSVQFETGDTSSQMASVASENNDTITNAIVDVHCGPLSLYLHDLGIDHIDFFSLDVEGAELLVLKTVDFEKVNIDVIMVESFNRNCREVCPKRDEVRKLMLRKGYKLLENVVLKSDVFIKDEF